VSRVYAGTLGLLAFLTCLVRGLMHGDAPTSVLTVACCGLLVFALLGSVLGWLASLTVEDAVRGRLRVELAAEKAAKSNAASTPAA
jgi:hypothetical protein